MKSKSEPVSHGIPMSDKVRGYVVDILRDAALMEAKVDTCWLEPDKRPDPELAEALSAVADWVERNKPVSES